VSNKKIHLGRVVVNSQELLICNKKPHSDMNGAVIALCVSSLHRSNGPDELLKIPNSSISHFDISKAPFDN
jgi:hypothetical protein